ncbi:MAG: hypothetical protein VXW87_04510 [Pseudomonadota bacterium]|nr:hypothetical protein [Pseudomonadota bacterium]
MRSIRQAITERVQPRVIEAMIRRVNIEELRDTGDDGQTVLMYAIEKRAAPAIICMLAQNMDAEGLSETSFRIRTALMMAIDSRLDADVIRAIVQNMDAAGLSKTCFRSRTALMMAIDSELDAGIIRAIAQNMDAEGLSVTCPRGRTALMMAIDSRLDADVIRAIVQNMDAEGLSATCPRGRTALMMAYRQADPATILALTEPSGGDPYAASAGEESDGEVSTDESEYDEVRERFAAGERQNRGDVVPSESARDLPLRPDRPAETEVPPAYTQVELPPTYEDSPEINHTNEARSQEASAADSTNVAELRENREGASLDQGGSYAGALGLFADLAGIFSSVANLVNGVDRSESSPVGSRNRSP